MNDFINHPPHYTNHPSGIECKEIAAFFPSPLANAIKYMWRYEEKKNPQQDLKKCIWYLNEAMNMPEAFIKGQMEITRNHLKPSTIAWYIEHEKNKYRKDFMDNMYKFFCFHNMQSIRDCIEVVENILDKEF